MKAKTSHHLLRGTVAAFVAASAAVFAQSGWNPTAAGTYDYLDAGNWDDGVINDAFPSTLALEGAQTATFGANHTATNGMRFEHGGNYALTLRADGSGAKTLTLGGDVVVNTVGGSSANVTFGNSTANQGLHVDLRGETRTFDVAASRALWFWNPLISEAGIIKEGTGNMVLRGSGSTFRGDIVVNEGTFTFGEQNSISDTMLGDARNTIYMASGTTLKFGSNNDKAHVVLSPLRDFVIANGKFTTPYGTANVNIPGNLHIKDGLQSVLTMLLSGDNRMDDGITYDGALYFSDYRNIGGTATRLARGNGAGTKTLSVIGTAVTNFSGNTLTFGTTDGTSISIQDPDNVFLWDIVNNKGQNSAGNPTFAKSGMGTLLVVTNQTYYNSTGIATVLGGGIMKIDYAAGGSLNQSTYHSRLRFSGGALYLLGDPANSITQTLSTVQLSAGGGTLTADNAGGTGETVVNLGDFTTFSAPVNGSALNIRTLNPGSGSVKITTLQTNAASGTLIPGRLVFNGTDWASANDESVIAAFTDYADLPASGMDGDTHYRLDGSAIIAADETLNTLKITTSQNSDSLSIAEDATLALDAGGLLFAGDGDYAVNGGVLAGSSATSPDLIVHHYGQGILTIDSVIANRNGTASTLTLAGTGTVRLSNTNTYTGVTHASGITLEISSNNNLNNGANTALYLYEARLRTTESLTTGRAVSLSGGGATFDVATGKTLTLSGSLSGGNLILDNSDAGDGILELRGSNSMSGEVIIKQGVLKLANNSALQPQGFNLLKFGNGTGQTLQINGARTITVAGLVSDAATAVVENGATGAAQLNVYNGADNVFNGTLRDGAAGTLALTKGGCGALTLTAATTHTGATVINGGSLMLNGSLESEVTVNRGFLAGSGAVNNNLFINDGATLIVGETPFVNGDIAISGNVNIAGVETLEPGRYTLFTCSGTATTEERDIANVPDNALKYLLIARADTVELRVVTEGTAIIVR